MLRRNGHTYPEIARRMQISVGRCREIVERAQFHRHSALREVLEQAGQDLAEVDQFVAAEWMRRATSR